MKIWRWLGSFHESLNLSNFAKIRIEIILAFAKNFKLKKKEKSPIENINHSTYLISTPVGCGTFTTCNTKSQSFAITLQHHRNCLKNRKNKNSLSFQNNFYGLSCSKQCHPQFEPIITCDFYNNVSTLFTRGLQALLCFSAWLRTQKIPFQINIHVSLFSRYEQVVLVKV